MAYQNKAKLYGLLFTAAAEALTTIAADPRHLGAEIGLTAVLHSWGQTMDHHPHVHCIVPGGGLSPDGKRWIACRPGFFLPVRVVSRIFRRLYLEGLARLHVTGQLQFFGSLAVLNDPATFKTYLAPLRGKDWVVYAKRPFAGPEQVLAYLARYTHRVAIANSRLIAMDGGKVRFRWKDYRQNGKSKMMTLAADEFMRRFLFTSCPMASTASGTLASLPTAIARRKSPSPGHYSASKRLNATIQHRTMPKLARPRITSRRHVPAAAGA